MGSSSMLSIAIRHCCATRWKDVLPSNERVLAYEPPGSRELKARKGGTMTRLRSLCCSSFVIIAIVASARLASGERIRVASSSPSLTARLPHFVAHEEGFFNREGLQVESIVVRNDATILAALAAGEFDYVETGAPPAVAAISKGLPFMIIGGFRSRLDYVLIGRKGLSSPKDLKGTKIGVTGPGGLSE